MDFSKISDRELYDRCVQIGGYILKYRRQFLGMLPEVEKRKLYRKYGMHSVFEFAARLGGMSRDIVNDVLHLSSVLHDKPVLHNALVSGDVGYAKLRTISTIATVENQKQCLEHVKSMSTRTLEMYVHELKLNGVHVNATKAENTENGNLFNVDSSEDFLEYSQKYCAATTEIISMQLCPETAAQLRLLKHRLEKEKKEVLSWQQVMERFLELTKVVETPKKSQEDGLNDGLNEINRLADKKSQAKIPPLTAPILRPRKEPNRQKNQKSPKELKADSPPDCVSRHIPIAVRRQILTRSRGFCEFPHCNKPFAILHHTERFSLKREHNPDTIAALCTPHERIAHLSLIANENLPPKYWKLLTAADKTQPKYQIDQIVRKFRMVT